MDLTNKEKSYVNSWIDYDISFCNEEIRRCKVGLEYYKELSDETKQNFKNSIKENGEKLEFLKTFKEKLL